MPAHRLSLFASSLAAVGLVLAGCAAPGTGSAPAADQTAEAAEIEFNDPLEDLNRSIFGFNQVVNEVALVPVAKGYRTAVPSPMRASVHDFLRNLNEPVTFANDVLQVQPGLAARTLARLTINSTVGFGGMFDVASRIGIKEHTNDMGITFATYGIAEGPYLVAPVLGPTNPRDIAGSVADSFIDPGNYYAGKFDIWYAPIARSVVSGVDVLSRNVDALADIEKTSLDFYATIRSLYRQRRAAEIRHEEPDLPNPGLSTEAPRNPAVSPFFANTPTFKEFSAK